MNVNLPCSLVLAFFSLLAPTSAWSQTVQIVEVDKDLGIIQKGFPYDEPFFVKFIYNSPPRIRYFELQEGKFKFKDTTVHDKITGTDITFETKPLRNKRTVAVINNYDTATADKKLAVFVPIPRLRPDKDYELAIFMAYSAQEVRQFLDSTFKLIKLRNSLPPPSLSPAYVESLSAPTNQAKLRQINNLAASLSVNVAPRTVVSKVTPIQTIIDDFKTSSFTSTPLSISEKTATSDSISATETYAIRVLREYVLKVDVVYTKAAEKLISYTAASPDPLLAALSPVTVKNAIDELLGQIKLGAIKADSQSVIPVALQTPLTTLLTVSDTDILKSYMYGQRTLVNVPQKAVLDQISLTPDTLFSLLNKTNSNLEKTIDALTKISLYSRATVRTANQPDLVDFCELFIKDLSARKKTLSELIKIYKEFTTLMQKDNRLVSREKNSVETIGASSTVFGFDTRAKLQIIPDLGLAYYSALSVSPDYAHFSYDHKNFNGFIPFFGVNISPLPINKNIPMRYLKNMKGSVWRRFSFFAGITLSSIAKEDERKDLFGSKSLLAGITYRLSNAFRIGAGAFLFNAKDPNPIISKYHMS